MSVNPVESGEEYQHLTNTGNTPNRLTVKVVSATFTACLGAIAFGFVMGYPSPVEKHLESKLNWSSQQLSWFNVSFFIQNYRINILYLFIGVNHDIYYVFTNLFFDGNMHQIGIIIMTYQLQMLVKGGKCSQLMLSLKTFM